MLIEGVVLGKMLGGVLWPAMVHVLAPRLAVLERGFDREFYLRQFSDPRQRQRVARAPLLHYALLGWRTQRAPSPGFDPAFYQRRNLDRPAGMDPLYHQLSNVHSRSSPRNEVEARTDRAPWREGSEAVLVFHHGRGGGSSHFLDLYERTLEADGYNVLRARTVSRAPTLAVLNDRTFDLATGLAQLVQFGRRERVKRLVVNHLIDRPTDMMGWMRDLATGLCVPYEVILHDYFMVCPRVDLITGQGVFCGVAPPETCLSCVTGYGAEAAEFDPLSWRDEHLAFLSGAGRVIAPSDDLASRMQQLLPRPITVWSPGSDAGFPAERVPRLAPDERLRIVTLGALNVAKGVRVVAGLAGAADKAAAPLDISVLGPVSEALPDSVAVSGPYRSEDLERLLAQASPHVVLLPAIWPETWSFVLTSALEQGVPVVVFDIGAPAARLRRMGRGHILPTALSTRPEELLAALLQLREAWIVR
jgi:glycosyltransferase involved in cell wall biosynthesis